MPLQPPVPRLFSAPHGERDCLSKEQVERYLTLLGAGDYRVLKSPAFEEQALRVFTDAGEEYLNGAALASAVQHSLSGSAQLQTAIAEEFRDAGAVALVISAYWLALGRPHDCGVIREEFPPFVRFCVAYRVHCYFETSVILSEACNGANGVDVGNGGRVRPEVVFALGGPGAGKGTQCRRIAEHFSYEHLAVGDLLREECKKPRSPNKSLIEEHIRDGKLISTEIVLTLLEQAMAERNCDKYVIDGFPRNEENIDGWDRRLAPKYEVKMYLFFECSEACMTTRLLEYGKTSGRADDNAESIAKRVQTFRQDSMPVVERLEASGLVQRVAAEQSVEEVWQSVQGILGPTVVFVLGGPGAGKGTQCKRIAEAFGYVHLSAGDLLREERARKDSKYGSLIEEYIKEGKIVPASITAELLRTAMVANGWQGGKYLIDGFPRNMDNLEAFGKTIKACVKYCLNFECSEGVMEARLLERGKTSGRSDDNIESIRKRFVTFYKETSPVVEKFKSEGRLRCINAELDVDTVWTHVQALFGPSVVFVLGGPGAGKGTQSAKIVDMFGYHHLSAGDLLREERARAGSVLGDLINAFIKEGKLVPVEITVKLLQQAMEKFGWEGGKYLIDGFPRSFENIEGWNKNVASKVNVRSVLFLDCSEQVMEERLLERGKTSGRADDNPTSIKKRLGVFQKESMPVVEAYEKQGLLRKIDGERPIGAVWADVRQLFGPSIIFVLGGIGAGKGTQCARIAQKFGYQHLCAGDLLREEERKAPDSANSQIIRECIREGKLVPADVMLPLLVKAMEERGWEGGRYVIDGYPRSMENLEAWQKILSNKVFMKLALFFECSEVVMEERALQQKGHLRRDTVRKALHTFQSESFPVIGQFQHTRLLRRIDAEQDVEEVWHSVQEVLHNELQTHIMNQAVLLLKPHAKNKETERYVQSCLTAHGVAVLQKGSVPAKDLAQKGFFDQHYLPIMCFAEADTKELKVAVPAQELFREKFGTAWSDAVAQGLVVSAAGALADQGLGMGTKELFDAWAQAESLQLARCLKVARLEKRNGGGLFVINAFVPHWRETLIGGCEALTWMVVGFSPAQLSWKKFRAEVVGATDPSKAFEGSIRAEMYKHWKMMGLKEQPDMMNNCVHASAGPVEGLRERMIWTGAELLGDPLGRLLMASGIPQAAIEGWLENPLVEGWCSGRQATSGPIFDCSEDCDTGSFRDSAVRYVQERLGTMQMWRVRARKNLTSSLWASLPRRPSKAPDVAPPRVMTIIHFNDVYNVEPRQKEPVGGVARFVTRVQELKAEAVQRGEPEAVVLFSGDAFNPSLTSTVTKGRHMIPVLNAIGIHTACYGNHDFDFGVDQLSKMASECNFPWLISNVVDKATGAPLADGLVTRMLNFHGRKIGLIGLVEREWLVTLATISPEDVEYEDFCPCARRLARQLKEKQGAEIVIALTHMRMPNDYLLAHEATEVDIILGGHDHHYEVGPVGPNDTYVLNSGTDFRDLTTLQIEFIDSPGSSRPFKVSSIKHVEVDATITEDPEMKTFVDDCMSKLGAAMDKVIGETAVDLDGRFAAIRTKETNIGNFVTDVLRQGLKADLAILNSGTLRADAIIEKGPVKMRDLVNLLPMLDELCLLQLSGTQVLSVLENSVSQYPRLEGRFAQVSGVTFTFDAAKPGGQRVVEGSVRIGNESLDASRNYKLVTKDYLRQGKDGYDVFRDALCLADGEQAGILPTMVRDYFADITKLNGYTSSTPQHSTERAMAMTASLARVGDGPEPMQRYAISPSVEGRIVCLNPA